MTAQVYVKRNPTSPPEWLSLQDAGLLDERTYDPQRVRGDAFSASSIRDTDAVKIMTANEREILAYLSISSGDLVLTLASGKKLTVKDSSAVAIAEFRDDQTVHLKNAVVVDL